MPEPRLFDADAPRRVSLVKLSGEIARAFAGIGRVSVEGEVHRPSTRPGGSIFFTLRDRAAQVTVWCPSAKARRCRVVAGERVCVTGRLTWANERGQVQLEAEEVVPVGEGAVAAMLADVRARLLRDGLLDRPRRRIPRLPTAVGVVCGSDAAVRADIESVVAARFPGYPVVFHEVTVSGPGAAVSIIEAVQALDAQADVDVIVLARGGGDATQLLPFSDEDLCRALCRCVTPVVSAVGHEGDRPLCDEVVDLRCGTPSIAAAAVVPDQAELQATVDRLLVEAYAATARHIDAGARRLAAVDRDRALDAALAVAQSRVVTAGERLGLVHPQRLVVDATRRLTASRDQLEALSPVRVLERGYAVVRDGDGTVVRNAAQVGTGAAIRIQLAAGRLGAHVDEVEAEPS